MTTQRLRLTLDLNIGDQEVLQRLLAQPQKIADVLEPRDVRENARIVAVLEEVAQAFAEVLFQVIELSEPEQIQQLTQGRG